MAKIIPITMSVEEYLKHADEWAPKRRLCSSYGLSKDALTMRLRSYRGRVEMLRVRENDGRRFTTPLYKRSQVHAAIVSFTKRREWVEHGDRESCKWLDAHEAAELLGFSRAESFRKWLSFCERKPRRAKKRRNYPSGKAKYIYFYEKESLEECRNWFQQRKRQEDRMPSLDGRSCGVDAYLSGMEVWEHMGYNRKELING